MRLSPWRLLAPRCDRSAPAQKAGDAPVTTMAPMSGSPSMASRVATISSTRSRVRALRRAGASRVTTATRSTVSVRSSGMAGSLAPCGRDVRGDDAIDALRGDSVADASVKASIVDLQTDADAAVLEELHAAQSELKARKGKQDEAAATADAKAASSAAALTDLESAQSQQAAFVLEVQARLDRKLSEAEALAKIDPALAAQLEAEQGAIAARLEAIRRDDAQREVVVALQQEQAEAAARQAAEAQAAAQAAAAAQPGGMGPASGSLATVACPGGGSITVDSSLASNLSQLLDAASAAGLDMCGGGYRDPAEQIALREAHCGSSYYAIYEAPSSSCSPPTARPGTSNHEQGLAVDFTCNGGGAISSQSSPCFVWLDNNAANYGFYKLPSEPWHWSNDGS